MKKIPPFDTIIFAGGGARCTWQVGFLESLARRGVKPPRHIGAASAGALMAALYYSGQSSDAIAYFMKKTAENPKNAYWKNLFTDKPVFPHYAMYRDFLATCLDEKAFKKLQRGPNFSILLARPPQLLGHYGGMLAGFSLYSLEKKIKNPVHATWTQKLGFSPIVLSVQEMGSAADLHEAILMSSCTPPFVPPLSYRGLPVLDGGLVDNVPLLLAPRDSTGTLVLLTRYYDNLPEVPGITYTAPSKPITVDKWDYTSPQGLADAHELGRADGEIWNPSA